MGVERYEHGAERGAGHLHDRPFYSIFSEQSHMCATFEATHRKRPRQCKGLFMNL
jgi:hypothetical protein